VKVSFCLLSFSSCLHVFVFCTFLYLIMVQNNLDVFDFFVVVSLEICKKHLEKLSSVHHFMLH
jgi:hypothetical protein